MSFNVILVLIGWLVAMAIFFGFIVLLRYLHHRETMALISHGINPESIPRRRRSRGMLRAGLIITMVGLALTIGLYPVGFFLPPTFATPFHLGPWLLPGLIPLGVGIALIVSYYLEQNALVSSDDAHDNVIPIKDRQEKNKKLL
jgi:MFS family permease